MAFIMFIIMFAQHILKCSTGCLTNVTQYCPLHTSYNTMFRVCISAHWHVVPAVKRMSHISILHTPHRIQCFVFVVQYTDMQYLGVKRMSHISVLHTPHWILCFVFVFQHTGMQYRLSSECHTFLSFTHL